MRQQISDEAFAQVLLALKVDERTKETGIDRALLTGLLVKGGVTGRLDEVKIGELVTAYFKASRVEADRREIRLATGNAQDGDGVRPRYISLADVLTPAQRHKLGNTGG